MTVHHCMYLVEEMEQNKWKSNKYEKEWPKNKGNIVKRANCWLSENLSEKWTKKSKASEIITFAIAHTIGH